MPRKLRTYIKIKEHRPLEGEPKAVCLYSLRADAKWYVLIVCDLGGEPPKRADGTIGGLDVGMKVFVADSEGNLVGNPHYYRRSYGRLRGAQRRTCRRKKGSKRRRKAARAVTKRYLKIIRRRKDFLHKTA
jgi:putative transposase